MFVPFLERLGPNAAQIVDVEQTGPVAVVNARIEVARHRDVQDHDRPADEQMAHHAPEECGETDARCEQEGRRPLDREYSARRERLGGGEHALEILAVRRQAALGRTSRAGGQADGEDVVQRRPGRSDA